MDECKYNVFYLHINREKGIQLALSLRRHSLPHSAPQEVPKGQQEAV